MKVALVTGMLPTGHYSQFLASGLSKLKGLDLSVCTDRNSENLGIQGCGTIKLVWSRSPKYIFEIVSQLKKDSPDIVHIQHELNMFGSPATALFFPFLLGLLKAMKFKVVVTVHAVVPQELIDGNFADLFFFSGKWVRPALLKTFFRYLFGEMCKTANALIVHTPLAKRILLSDYKAKPSKVIVIPTTIPQKTADNSPKERYFFYFGYMVRRKGLEYVLEGFKKFLDKNPGSDYRLVLAGGTIPGQQKALEEIRSEIEKNGLSGKVILRGFLKESDMDDLYQKASAIVLPAKISIAASGPLYHAFGYGKFVIASKVGHFLDEIQHLNTGYLVDNDKWQEAFQFVVDNPTPVRSVELNIRQKASMRAPVEIAKIYEEVYRKVCSSAVDSFLERSCILCGGIGEAYIQHKNFQVIRCPHCGLYYQHPQATPGETEGLYNNLYEEKPRGIQDKHYWKKRMENHYKDIATSFKKPGSLLDIGCSYGWLMKYFQSKGWDVTGIDISENAVNYARSFGLDCFHSAIDDFCPAKKFDCIIMSNVLEHLGDPLRDLNIVKNWLSPEGMIYIRVPNAESIVLLSRRQSFLGDLKPFEHLFYFTKDTLRLLLQKAGLKSRIKTDGWVNLGNALNSYIRSKFVLRESWQDLNYKTGAEQKKKYLLLKHIYGEFLSALGYLPLGPNNRELVVFAQKEAGTEK